MTSQKYKSLIQIKTADKYFNNTSEGKLSYIAVKAKDGQLNNLKNIFNKSYPEYVVSSGNDMANQIKKMLLYVTLLFVGIGAAIMVIATSKTVGERTREIGVLKAIGWSNIRIMALILSESLMQFIIAWVLVLIIIIIIYAYTVLAIPEVGAANYLKENIVMVSYILGFSLVLSVLMPLLGCLIPLLRVARLKPTEALKYE